jgi:hypothetical protein
MGVEKRDCFSKEKKQKAKSFYFHEKTYEGRIDYGFEAEIKYDEGIELYPIVVIHRFYSDMRNFNYKEIDKIDKKNIIKQLVNLFLNGSLVYLDYRFKLIKFSTDGYRYHINVFDYKLSNIMFDLVREMVNNSLQGYIYGRCSDGEKIFELKEYLNDKNRLGCEIFNRIATDIGHLKKTDELFEIGAKKYNEKYKK